MPEGEQRTELSNFIKENNLSKNIKLFVFIENIFPYFKNSNGFILTSLWEDPGFVLVEAAFCRAPILSSNSWPGPIEFIKKDFNGLLFNNNDMQSFLNEFKKFNIYQDKNYLKLNSLKICKKFSLFNHYNNLISLIYIAPLHDINILISFLYYYQP